jgi:tetratricopeptide (TPR) repeat protein
MRRFFLQPVLFLLLALPIRSMPQSQQSSDQKQADQKQSDENQPERPDQKQPDSKQQPDAKQPDDKSGESSSSSSSAPGAADELQHADTSPKYDPFPAEQDVEVGTFYLHKGDTDAAISRFEDAIRLKSNFAKPRLLLAQIYEKKNDKITAVKYYKEYLEVYAHAPDAKKIQEKITKLTTR